MSTDSAMVNVQSASGNTDIAQIVTSEQLSMIDAAIHANIDSSEVQFSRLAIMQPLSPEVSNQLPGYKQGQIVDNINREIVSERMQTPWLAGKVPSAELQSVECVEFVPIFKLPSEFIKWKNRNTEGPGMHFKTLDPRDPRVREGIFPPRGTFRPSETQKSPPVTENINIFAVLIDNATRGPKMMPVVITFAKTSFKTGRRLVTMCEGLRFSNLPFFAQTFWLYTRKTQNEAQQVYYVFEIARGDLLSVSAPGIVKQVVETATALSDPETGKEKQESIINAAALQDEGDSDGASSGSGDTSVVSGGTEDAF